MNLGYRIRMVLLGAIVGLVFGALAAVPAAAASGQNAVITDCLTHPGGLTGHYTVKELQRALQVMSAETKEYTDCSDVINRAELAAIGGRPGGGPGGGGGGGGGGSFLPTPVIVVLVLLVLAAVTFGAVAIRRRRVGDGPSDAAPGGGLGSPAD